MKLAKSYFNKPLFIDLLKRHWWFGFINLIVLFFAIPINYLLTTQRFTSNRYGTIERALEELYKYTAAFFSVEGAVITAVVTMLAALVGGLVLFGYLHKKDQINFFHSQPVSRECLFTVRIGAGILLFILPYLVNIGIALIVTAIKGTIASVAWGALLGQIGFVLLTFAAIYAIVVLAGILTGTIFAQAQLTVIIVFAPLLVYASVIMLCQRFYSTFFADYFFQKLIYYSPVTHLITLVSGESQIGFWICLLYIGGALALFALALWLYQKRPSEGAGSPLIFTVSRPLVKYVSCFISAVVLGMFFDQLGGLSFMIFGFVAGAILCSLFAEAQFNRDFKAMFDNMKKLAVFGVLFGLFVSAIAFDITGYDRYLPAKDEVKAVSFTWNDNDVRPILHNQRGYYNRDLAHLTFQDPQIKSDLLTAIDHTLQTGAYSQKKRSGSPVDQMAVATTAPVNNRSLTVIYELNNGKQVPRQYNSVAMKPIKDQVQHIISSDAYKAKHSINQMVALDLPRNIMIEQVDQLNLDYRISKHVNQPQQIAAMVAAVKNDIQQAGASIDNQAVYVLSIEGKDYNARINVYENYHNTLALLTQITSDTDKTPVGNDLAAITKLEIRPMNNPKAQPLVVEDPAKIQQILKVSLRYWGDAMTLADDDYVIEIPRPSDSVKDAYASEMAGKAMESKEQRYFVLGKVPDFVRAGVK